MFAIALLKKAIPRVNVQRTLHVSSALNNIKPQADEPTIVQTREITKDRTQTVPLETSLRYLKSAAYKQTYGDKPVWVQYR